MKKRIPTVDANLYIQGSLKEKKEFIQNFGSALKEFGFVILEGHNVSTELIQNTYQSIRHFFGMPLEQKLKYVDPSGWGKRGYTSFGKEKAKYNSIVDLKEFWHTGRENFTCENSKHKYPKNIWLENDDFNFHKNLTDLYNTLDELAKILLMSLSEYLNLPKFTLSKMIVDGDSVLRALHYPALTEAQASSGALRAAEHEDINFLTILCEATESGLQILTRDGTWIDVETEAHQMVIDSGDMLSRITNGVIPSTTHRVINPNKSHNVPRFSCPFFIHAHENCELKMLGNCVSPSFPFQYEPITAGAFLRERLRANGLGGN